VQWETGRVNGGAGTSEAKMEWEGADTGRKGRRGRKSRGSSRDSRITGVGGRERRTKEEVEEPRQRKQKKREREGKGRAGRAGDLWARAETAADSLRKRAAGLSFPPPHGSLDADCGDKPLLPAEGRGGRLGMMGCIRT